MIRKNTKFFFHSETSRFSSLEDGSDLSMEIHQVSASSRSSLAHLSALLCVEFAAVVHVIHPVGPHHVGDLEIANGKLVSAQPLALLLLKLCAHLIKHSLSCVEVSLGAIIVSLTLHSSEGHLSPLFVQEIESGIDIPAFFGGLGVVAELLSEISGKGTSLVHLHALLFPAGKATSGEASFLGRPFVQLESAVSELAVTMFEHETQELSTAVTVEVGKRTLGFLASEFVCCSVH